LDAVVSDEPRTGIAVEPPHRNGGGATGLDTDDGGGGDGARHSWLLRVSLLVALVVLIGLWGYALVYSVMRKDPERLSRSERAAVLHACDLAATQMRALPPVPNPPTNATVSARASAETDVLARMVATGRRVQPARSAAKVALRAWFDDWDALLRSRRVYAHEVQRDKGAQLVTPVDAGGPIFVRMNKYAQGKSLEDCSVEALGATSVNALRKE
jgi:hypothetical protein